MAWRLSSPPPALLRFTTLRSTLLRPSPLSLPSVMRPRTRRRRRGGRMRSDGRDEGAWRLSEPVAQDDTARLPPALLLWNGVRYSEVT